MQMARTSFSESSLSLLPAATSNPPEALFDLDDHQRARHSASDYYEAFQLALQLDVRVLDDVGCAIQTLVSWDRKRPDAPVLWDSTIQPGEQFLKIFSVTADTWITRSMEAELTVTGSDDQQDEIDTILASYEDRYRLRRPIQVEFEDVAADAVIAHFYEAEIAVTGSDRQDAKASLVSWIFDIFDDLADANHQTLGRTPALQIRVLNKYISRRT